MMAAMTGDTVLEMASRAEWRSQAILSAGVVGMWEWDHARDTARYCSIAADLLAGDPNLAWRELAGDQAMAAVHADDAPILRARMRRDTSEPDLEEYQIRISSAGVRRVLCGGRSCRDADGKLLRTMGTVIDITGLEPSPASDGRDKLDEAAERGVAAYKAAQATGLASLIGPARALLMAVGQEIARRLGRGGDLLR